MAPGGEGDGKDEQDRDVDVGAGQIIQRQDDQRECRQDERVGSGCEREGPPPVDFGGGRGGGGGGALVGSRLAFVRGVRFPNLGCSGAHS